MNIHQAFAYMLAATGYAIGYYFIKRARQALDTANKANLLALGLLDIYVGIIYTLILLGFVNNPEQDPQLSSLLMRPANLLFILLPWWISRKMRWH